MFIVVKVWCFIQWDCYIWIGVLFQYGFFIFVYNSGKLMVYLKWVIGQLNNKNGDQECVGLMWFGEGNDWVFYEIVQYFC